MNRKGISHPSSFIPASLTEVIRGLAPEAEKLGRLHSQQLSIIYEQKWFNLFVPEEYGGLALSLPEGLKIEESLAWADGSTAWTVTLCSGANWFTGFLQRGIAKHVFRDEKTCFAGSGRPSGIANRTEYGYEITGVWKYASGAPHATVFTANCLIEEEGVAVHNADGSPLVRAFLFLREEVILEEDWRSIGMIATASHSFKVEQLLVKENRCFTIDNLHPVLSHPIYQFPFLQFAEATLAVNSSGMAARFIEIGERIAARRDTLPSQYLEEVKTQLQELRQSFYTAVQFSWDACALNQQPSPALLSEVSKASRRLAAGARRLVDELYPWCGLAAADPDTEINRVWRNLHTASQHSLLTSSQG
jgi:alkylation response protein AidB-like acyl-CoA dehydrogenase